MSPKRIRRYRVTIIQYIKESGVGTTAEIMGLARESKADFEGLKRMAHEQAKNLGVVIEESPAKA